MDGELPPAQDPNVSTPRGQAVLEATQLLAVLGDREFQHKKETAPIYRRLEELEALIKTHEVTAPVVAQE